MDGLALMKCLADEIRYRIVELLADGELSVTELLSRLNKEQSLISHHLSGMREQGIVVTRHSGKKVYYRLADHAIVEFLRDANRLAHSLENARSEKILGSEQERDSFEESIERGED